MNIYMRTNAKIKSGEVTAYYILSAETSKGEATLTKKVTLIASQANAELLVLTEAIERIKKPCEVNIYAETSQFAASYQMMERWAANDWKTTKGEDVKNKEEWMKLHEFAKVHRCTLFLQCHHDYRKWLEEELRR